MKNLLTMAIAIILVAVIATPNELLADRMTNPFAEVENGSITWVLDKSLMQEDFEAAWDITISDMSINFTGDLNDYSYLVITAVNNSDGINRTILFVLDPVLNSDGNIDIRFRENIDGPGHDKGLTVECKGCTVGCNPAFNDGNKAYCTACGDDNAECEKKEVATSESWGELFTRLLDILTGFMP